MTNDEVVQDPFERIQYVGFWQADDQFYLRRKKKQLMGAGDCDGLQGGLRDSNCNMALDEELARWQRVAGAFDASLPKGVMKCNCSSVGTSVPRKPWYSTPHAHLPCITCVTWNKVPVNLEQHNDGKQSSTVASICTVPVPHLLLIAPESQHPSSYSITKQIHEKNSRTVCYASAVLIGLTKCYRPSASTPPSNFTAGRLRPPSIVMQHFPTAEASRTALIYRS